MNFFNLFGNKQSALPVIPPQKVIQNMKETLRMLEKRETFLEKNIDTFKTEARIYVKTNKQKAINLLKKAKLNEKQLNSIYGQKENIETQIFSLEQGISNKNTIEAMKQGNKATKLICKKLNPDDIDDLMENISFNIEVTDEITTLMSNPVGQIYDGDDLLSELTEENNEVFESDIPKIPIKIKEVESKEVESKEVEELEKYIGLVN
jgi:charged multivesicular body protein 4